MELDGVRVAVTRPRRSSAELRQALEQRGATVVELPLLEIVPAESLSVLDAALGHLEDYTWIAFTSGNAVEPVLARLAELRAPVPAALSIAAVGPVTAERLRRHGLTVHCCPAETTSAALAGEMIGSGVAGRRVLLPCGDRSRPDLPDALRAAGAYVDSITVYRTVPSPRIERAAAILAEGEVDVVALASPSAVDALVAAVDGDLAFLRRVRLVCIGPTTADAVREAGLEPASVADPHTAAGLVAAIAALYTE